MRYLRSGPLFFSTLPSFDLILGTDADLFVEPDPTSFLNGSKSLWQIGILARGRRSGVPEVRIRRPERDPREYAQNPPEDRLLHIFENRGYRTGKQLSGGPVLSAPIKVNATRMLEDRITLKRSSAACGRAS